MWAVLSNLGHRNCLSLGAGIVIGACMITASAAVPPALPKLGAPVLFDDDYLEAATLIDDSAQAMRRLPTAMGDQRAPSLFGMDTEPVAGEVAAKWRAVKADIDREQQVLARCRTQEACPAVAQNLLDIISEGAGRSGRARVGLINRAVNLAITPSSDPAQWGVADRWSPPFETLQTHRGDCEDYAILKYVALVQSGLSSDDVKIVILRNILPKEDHAALAAHVDGQWLLLDNRRLALVHDTKMAGYVPRFVLDEDGARRFVLPDQPAQGPSAGQASPAGFVWSAWPSA
jgi:predicted transglutaminase-like cysteine proteinase